MNEVTSDQLKTEIKHLKRKIIKLEKQIVALRLTNKYQKRLEDMYGKGCDCGAATAILCKNITDDKLMDEGG